MEENQLIATTELYDQIVQAEEDGINVLLLQGGSRSSKTWSIFQFFQWKALDEEKFTLTITREHLQLIRDTLLLDLEEMDERFALDVTPEINPNRPSQTYQIENAKFTFWGLDKPKKAHGRKQTYTWMNEVMEIPNKGVFDQLEMRTEKMMILDYNPSDEDHWVFELQKRPDVRTLISTVLDNPFAPDKIRRKILGYEPTKENYEAGTADPYMWDVYGLGKPAKLEGVVYEKWEIVDDIPEDAKDIGLGLDFGYTNDPTALTDIYVRNGNELYLDELIYRKGLQNASPEKKEITIVSLMTDLGIGNREITADSSEPKSIAEIKSHGFNINGANKGKDSVNHGIQFLQGFKIYVTRRSINIQKELRKYKWAQDKAGKALNVPVDEFNHALDGVRYRVVKALGKKKEVKIYRRGSIG